MSKQANKQKLRLSEMQTIILKVCTIRLRKERAIKDERRFSSQSDVNLGFDLRFSH